MPVIRGYDSLMLVCATLLVLAPQIESEDVAPIMNMNIPGFHFIAEDVRHIIRRFNRDLPEWLALLRTVDTDSEVFRVTIELLQEGLLARRLVPLEDITMEGLHKTLGRIIFYARQHATNTGPTQGRRFERTQEDDAFGYTNNDDFGYTAGNDFDYTAGNDFGYTAGNDFGYTAGSDFGYTAGSDFGYTAGSDFGSTTGDDYGYTADYDDDLWDHPSNWGFWSRR